MAVTDVKFQAAARRALEVAAMGGHSVLITGSSGSGKSMLAARIPGILPVMRNNEALAAPPGSRAAQHCVRAGAGGRRSQSTSGQNFANASRRAMCPHELPAFSRQVPEVLHEPLETGHIMIFRAARQTDFPARFQRVVAMNPCPCGYLSHAIQACRDTPDQITRYCERISRRPLNRIDIHMNVPALTQDELMQVGAGEARKALLKHAISRLNLSARAYHRVLKLARSVADLTGSETITSARFAEAIQHWRQAA